MTISPDPELIAAMTTHRTSRRRFLGAGGAALGALAVGPTILSACGGGSSSSGSSDSLTILNWPLYLEDDDPKTSPTVKGFTDATGIKVTYKADIDGNESFNTKYEATLAKGKGIGADIIVLTTWNAAAYIGAGLVQPFDASLFPNKRNVISRLANPTWDPGRAKSIPWSVGQTGLAYWPDKVGGRITDVNAIFDPKFKGKVTILDELRDTVGLTMLGMGNNPQTGTVSQMLAAVDKIGKARDAGQFKKVTGNSYTEDLALGDTWIAVAWSGDVAQLQADHPGLEWVIPSQGGMLWVDNAMIPVGAKNPEAANKWLDWMYNPKVAGPLYESIQYIPPVQGATDYMSAAAKSSAFINPPATPPLYEFEVIDPDDAEKVAEAFVKATEQ